MSTATATAARITYRKTKAGQWVAFGPASAIIAGCTVTVTKASGETKTELIESVGRPFDVNGAQCVYGYLAPSARPASATTTRRAGSSWAMAPAPGSPTDIRTPSRRSARMCDNCGERRAVTTARDLSGFCGDVCGQCKREEGSLSFC